MKRSALVFASIALLRAQAPVEFEVASVKVDKQGTGVRGGCHGFDSKFLTGDPASATPLGRCVITAGRLSHMIGIAWQLPMDSIKDGPDWVMRGFDRFDVQAEAENPRTATDAQLRSMLQAMLIERFQLKFHRETVERAGWALAIGEHSPRMKVAEGEDYGAQMGDFKAAGGPVDFRARAFDMAHLAQMLSVFDHKPVVDETGLHGSYDLTLHWDNDQGPTLETAVREQLGLKLVPKKVPVELFVIDSAQKPSAN